MFKIIVFFIALFISAYFFQLTIAETSEKIYIGNASSLLRTFIISLAWTSFYCL